MRNGVWGLLLAMLVIACGCRQRPASDDSVTADLTGPSSSLAGLDAVAGTVWTGTETATVGESGALTVTFAHGPDGPPLIATVQWTSARSSQTYAGTLSGTLASMAVVATSGTACVYAATGQLNTVGAVMTGSYTATGPGPCPRKAGTFFLHKSITTG